LPARPVKIGVVGCGDRGTGIMHILNQMPDMFQITAICDVLDFRLAAAQKSAKPPSWKLILITANCWTIKTWKWY
jgi:predicted homoserine dehydrogenase-like protein